MSHSIIADILIIFLSAVPVAYVFHRLKLPPIIGFLVTGALIGPAGLGLVEDAERIDLLAEVGVALLVFSLGLEFSLKNFGDIKAVSIGGGLVQIASTIAVTAALAVLFGMGPAEGIFLGCILSLSSTAIVYYLLSQKRLVDSPFGRISVGILILQDLSVVLMIAFLPFLAMTSLDWPGIFAATVSAAFLISLSIIGGKFVLPHILHHVMLTRSKELFLISVLVLALGFSYLGSVLGFSLALGAFLAGLMVSETEFRFHALSEIAPLRYCFNGLFFVSIGMLFNPAILLQNWWWIPVIVAGIPLAKSLITSLAVFFFRYPVSVSIMSGLALSQVGEFSFILALAGRHAGILSGPVYNFVIDAAFVTILITPVVMSLSTRAASFMERVFPFLKARCSRRAAEIDVKHLSGHVIICGFGPLGSSIGHILEQAGRKYVVLELNPATVRKMRSTGADRHVYLGDGASAEILYQSGIERAEVLAITAPDYMNSVAIIKQARMMSQNIKIITRAKFRSQVDDLYAAGADIVISEELEAGIEMGRYTLLNMGVDESTIEQYTQVIRAFGSADFF